jgi:hypothetical protein
MRLVLGLCAVLSVSIVTTGCGPACNAASACAVTGAPGPDQQVCDGSDNITCNDGNRGKVIDCGKRNQRAVCTPNGWAFEPTGPSNDGGI